MKKFLLAFLTILISLSSCSSYKARKIAEQERAQFVKDSIARVEFVRDSIALANKRAQEARERRAQFVRDSTLRAENEKTIARCSKLFRVKSDEFSSSKWYYPQSAPHYVNSNACYCYFSFSGYSSQNFRFRFQYYGDSWLFIKSMIFNIDGTNYRIEPEMKRDNDTMIWEWCDVRVVKKATLDDRVPDEDFIKRLGSAKSVKIKLNGTHYYDTKTLTSSQIKAIKNAYDYYVALGGTFE